MDEVLRRVEDLLVGDVVAHEGRARKVERVRRNPLSALSGAGEIWDVTFEDSEEIPARRLAPEGPKFKRPERARAGRRFLLLESHYNASKE